MARRKHASAAALRGNRKPKANNGYRFGPGWADVTPGFTDAAYREGLAKSKGNAIPQADGGKRGAPKGRPGVTTHPRPGGPGRPNPGGHMGMPDGTRTIPQADGGKRGRPKPGGIPQADGGFRHMTGSGGSSTLVGVHSSANPHAHANGAYGKEVAVGGRTVVKRRRSAP